MTFKNTTYLVRFKFIQDGKLVGAWHVGPTYFETKKEALEQKQKILEEFKNYKEDIYCEIKKEITNHKSIYETDHVDLDDAAIHYFNEIYKFNEDDINKYDEIFKFNFLDEFNIHDEDDNIYDEDDFNIYDEDDLNIHDEV